jgi:uncharacterized membrane protein
MFLALRIVHILTGVFWAGSVFFLVSFLQPAFRDVGPDGAKVFGALRARRMFTWTPVMALFAILSGLWMYMVRMGGGSGWAATREAMALGAGAVAALLGFFVGVFMMRGPTLRAADLAAQAGPMPAGAEKDRIMAEVAGLRARATMGGRTVATLLFVTVIAMAVARYL